IFVNSTTEACVDP
ncbi:hypothetical protein A2U01_0104933, partial [Trifolium medium]|nr:hypothetical protein [Trifolium medium]